MFNVASASEEHFFFTSRTMTAARIGRFSRSRLNPFYFVTIVPPPPPPHFFPPPAPPPPPKKKTKTGNSPTTQTPSP